MNEEQILDYIHKKYDPNTYDFDIQKDKSYENGFILKMIDKETGCFVKTSFGLLTENMLNLILDDLINALNSIKNNPIYKHIVERLNLNA